MRSTDRPRSGPQPANAADALSQNFSPLAHPGSLPSAAVSLYAWLIPRGSRGTRPPRMSFRRLLGSEIVTVEPMSVPRTSYDVCGETPLWCPIMVCGGGVDNAWCTIHQQQHTHSGVVAEVLCNVSRPCILSINMDIQVRPIVCTLTTMTVSRSAF